MNVSARWRSGKTHRDENFPVASRLVAARHRPAILAFYRFARAADDAADHSALPPGEKLRLLDELEATLLGDAQSPDALPLRAVLAERRLSPRHPRDLLGAFRLDVEKRRYHDWNELMDYCALSAMPVGRFVLDVHGEDEGTWAASDPLCAALQVINHLQDCGKDFRDLDRVYIPLDAFAGHGARVEDLGGTEASPALRNAIASLAEKAGAMLGESASLTAQVRDWRLGLEISAIRQLAVRLVEKLRHHDPLSQTVHLRKPAMLAAMAGALLKGTAARLRPAPAAVQARR